MKYTQVDKTFVQKYKQTFNNLQSEKMFRSFLLRCWLKSQMNCTDYWKRYLSWKNGAETERKKKRKSVPQWIQVLMGFLFCVVWLQFYFVERKMGRAFELNRMNLIKCLATETVFENASMPT